MSGVNSKLLAIGLFLFANLCSAETYTHERTGLKFEDSVDDLVKAEVTNYENKKAGLGVSVDYRGVGKKLTIYIYNLRHQTIANDLNDPVFIENYKNAINEVFSIHNDVRMKEPARIPYQGKELKSNWLMTVFETHDQGRDQNSYLMCTTYKNYFVKLRYTYDLNFKKTAEPTGGRAFEYVAEQFKQ
jgi:hypothetical protein